MRVGITVGSDRSEEIAELFAAEGLRPIVLPCTMTQPAEKLDIARDLLQQAELIIITSSRAIAVLWPDGVLPRTPFAVVGSTTAGRVEELGGVVEMSGTSGAAELVDSLDLSGRQVFFPHAAGTNPEVIEALRQRSGELHHSVVYTTASVAPASDPVDAVAFGSPSAVEGWIESRPFPPIIGTIGTTTATAVRKHGGRVDVIPPRPDFADLAASLAGLMEVSDE